ncbi:MAG TPA: alpha/beta hydrolase [Ktedonobacteraceae bacterium]
MYNKQKTGQDSPLLSKPLTRKPVRQTVQVHGLTVHYEVAGANAGEALVLVHGFSESTRLWYRNLPALTENYRVYLVDLPGFGLMGRCGQHFSLPGAGEWLHAWMQAVGLEEAHLIGHSMGGYVSMALAARHPESVKRLVLVDSIGIPLGLPAVRLVPMVLKAIVYTTPISLWLRMGRDYLRMRVTTIRNVVRQIVALDGSAVVAAVHVPTLLIWGENDDLIPFAAGRQLHQSLPGARLLVIQGANHFCMYERPAEFNAALSAFLEGQDVGIEAALDDKQIE